jgi:hypothetical protein
MILNDFVSQLVSYACRYLLYGPSYFFLSFRFKREWSLAQWLQVLILCGEDVGSNPAESHLHHKNYLFISLILRSLHH